MADATQTSWFARHKVITVILIIFGSVVILYNIGKTDESETTSTTTPADEPATPAAPEEEAIPVTAVELFSAYKENTIAADSQYKDKLVEVSGAVDNIGKDILDAPYVSMNCGGQCFGSVQCMLKAGEDTKALSLKQGDAVTFRGRVDGYLMNVLIRECVFVGQNE